MKYRWNHYIFFVKKAKDLDETPPAPMKTTESAKATFQKSSMRCRQRKLSRLKGLPLPPPPRPLLLELGQANPEMETTALREKGEPGHFHILPPALMSESSNVNKESGRSPSRPLRSDRLSHSSTAITSILWWDPNPSLRISFSSWSSFSAHNTKSSCWPHTIWHELPPGN